MTPEPNESPDFSQLPIFAGLTPREKEALAAKAKLARWQPGEVFCRQGEFTGRFHVVVDGVVDASRQERGETRVLETLGPNKWFGEVSALSNQPTLATLKAVSVCSTVSIPPGLFKDFYARKAGTFRRLIDENYRARGLLIHLRTAPLFRGLAEEELKRLRQEVAFQSFEPGQKIARQGEEASAVYFVRSGAIKCVRPRDGGEHILQHLGTNQSFGERCLADGERAWRGDYVAITATDCLVVPREVMKRHFSAQAIESLRATAGQLAAEEDGVHTGFFDTGAASPAAPSALQSSAARELLVAKESAKGGEALVINLEHCVRCNACVESCVAVHEDRVPRLSKRGTRMPYLGHEGVRLVTSCYHCQMPSCMSVCGLGAIRRDVQGLIRIDYENCKGCATCADACPYDVIRMARPEEPAERPGFWESLPLLGRFFAREEPSAPEAPPDPDSFCRGKGVKEGAPTPTAVKCDLCAGLPFQACVYNCPTSAIGRRNPAELLKDLAASKLRGPGTFSYTRQ